MFKGSPAVFIIIGAMAFVLGILVTLLGERLRKWIEEYCREDADDRNQ